LRNLRWERVFGTITKNSKDHSCQKKKMIGGERGILGPPNFLGGNLSR